MSREQQFLIYIETVIQQQGWSSLQLDIAHINREFNLEEDAVFSKIDIIRIFINYIKNTALQDFNNDEDSCKDRLFDLVMSCFDIATIHKPIIKTIAQDIKTNPCEVIDVTPIFIGYINWILLHSGINIEGIAGQIKVRLFGILLLYIFYIWLNDNTLDLSETMAKLDKVITIFINKL